MGPIGTVLAVLLARAGHTVSVHCYEPERAELFLQPLKLTGYLEGRAALARVHTDYAGLVADSPDVVLLCTKACFSGSVLEQVRRQAPKPSMAFISCQNGLESEAPIRELFGPERTGRMVLNLGCSFQAPDTVRVAFCFESILSHAGGLHVREEQVARDLVAAGLPTRLSKRYEEDVFRKAVLNTSMGSVCAMTGMDMRQVMDEPELRRMVKELAREAVVLAKALRYQFDDSFIDEVLGYLDKAGHHMPSLAQDVLLGRPSENEFHAGALFRLAERHGVSVDVIQTLYYLIKHRERLALQPKGLSAPGGA
jgi:2-dehydropantoate 2-reductase